MSAGSQTYPIIINLIAAIIGAVGQYLYKLGGQKIGVVPINQNWQILVGVCLFCLVMVLLILSFKLGGRLSTTYPMYATTFVWATLIGIFYDQEPWHFSQLIGILMVIIGISIVAISTNN